MNEQNLTESGHAAAPPDLVGCVVLLSSYDSSESAGIDYIDSFETEVISEAVATLERLDESGAHAALLERCKMHLQD